MGMGSSPIERTLAFAFQTYLVVGSNGGAIFYPRRSIDTNSAFSMLFPRNLFIDKDWKSLIPTFTKAGKQYLDVDKYGRFSILYSNIYLKLKCIP